MVSSLPNYILEVVKFAGIRKYIVWQVANVFTELYDIFELEIEIICPASSDIALPGVGSFLISINQAFISLKLSLSLSEDIQRMKHACQPWKWRILKLEGKLTSPEH